MTLSIDLLLSVTLAINPSPIFGYESYNTNRFHSIQELGPIYIDRS